MEVFALGVLIGVVMLETLLVYGERFKEMCQDLWSPLTNRWHTIWQSVDASRVRRKRARDWKRYHQPLRK